MVSDPVPIAEFGPSTKNRFGNPSTAIDRYASGYGRNRAPSDVPPRPRTGNGGSPSARNPVAQTSASSATSRPESARTTPRAVARAIPSPASSTLSSHSASRYPTPGVGRRQLTPYVGIRASAMSGRCASRFRIAACVASTARRCSSEPRSVNTCARFPSTAIVLRSFSDASGFVAISRRCSSVTVRRRGCQFVRLALAKLGGGGEGGGFSQLTFEFSRI